MTKTPTLGSSTSASLGSDRDRPGLPMICPECGADRVANSHAKGRDRLVMKFLPKRPYRCLHCYHRFWKRESFFESQDRILSWLAVIALLCGLALVPNWSSKTQVKPEPFSDFGSAPNAVPGQPPVNLLNEGETQASLTDQQAAPSVETEASQITAKRSRGATQKPSDTALDSVPDSQDTIDSDGVTAAAAASEEAGPAVLLEQLYTTEQLQQRLALAKAAAEQAEEASRQEQARLQRSVATEQDELQSLLKVDINFRIDSWRKAWEVGFVDDYLSFYSEKFRPANEQLTRAQWVAQRKLRIRPSKKIDLSMSNFDVEFSDNNSVSVVSFDQVYQSGDYIESSRKKLVLNKESKDWKIVSETETDQQVDRTKASEAEE